MSVFITKEFGVSPEYNSVFNQKIFWCLITK